MPRPRRVTAAGVLLALGLSIFTLGSGVANAAPTVFTGVMPSFDLTNIAYSVFLPDGAGPSHKVPAIFMTHGWGGSRATSATDATVKAFLDADLAVVTWDSRGFGASGGDANVDSQELEVRDLETLITFVAGGQYNPGADKKGARDIATDDSETIQKIPATCAEGQEPDEEGVCYQDVIIPPKDPRMGMYGGSYAGGIQLMGASSDARIDAIAPQIAWNDLVQSLKPNGVIRQGWDLLLYGAGVGTSTATGLPAGETGSVAPQIHQATAEALATNDWSHESVKWFDAKSPTHYIDGGQTGDYKQLPGINVPTLVIQGTNDTLFSLNQGIANYNQIRARVGDEKTKMIWYCGGHVLAAGDTATVPNTPAKYPDPIPNPPPAPAPAQPPHTNVNPTAAQSCKAGDQSLIMRRVVAWMDRWLRGNASADVGAPLEYQLQNGTWYSLLDPAGLATSELPSQAVAAVRNMKTTATHLVAPTSGQLTAPTPAGCEPSTGTGTLPSVQQVRDVVNYEQTCQYPFADWIQIGTYTGVPPYKCGPVVLQKKPCLPTFEPIKPGTILLGAPKLHVRVTGNPVPDAMLFFKLIDYNTVDRSRVVIDDHVTPLRIHWPNLNTPQFFDIELDGVAWKLEAGHTLYLETAPSSNDFATSRYPTTLTAQIDAEFPGISPFGRFNTEKVTFPNTAMLSLSESQSVTLQNVGGQALSLGNATLNQFTSYGGPVLNITTQQPIPSTDYEITADGCSGQTLLPLETCSVSTRFKPKTPGTKVAGLLVPGVNGPVQPYPVLLTGLATTPLAPTPSRLGFGFVLSGQTSDIQTVTLKNGSTGDITITSEETTGDKTMFVISNDTCLGATLAPGASCTADIQYAPTATKAHVATLKFKNTGAASCATAQTQCEQVILSGTADKVPPSINELSPTGGTSTPATATITIEFSGTVTDPVAVDEIKIHVVNTASAAAGQPGAHTVYDARCVSGCGGPNVEYSLSLAPGTGDFEVWVEATNSFGLKAEGQHHDIVVTPA